MKKAFLIILFLTCISSSAQMYEVGFFGGGTNFVGDVGASDYFKPNRPSLGLVFKYNINPRIALRTNYNYYSILGDDLESDNEVRNQRGLTFENNLNEISLGIEYNFFEYNLSSFGKRSTPYILLQLGLVDYKTPRTTNLSGDVIFTRRTAMTIPMGLGYKSILYGKLAFALEARAHYALTDGIDFTTSSIPELNFGGTSDDWFMFVGISLVYTFGRPPCYSTRR